MPIISKVGRRSFSTRILLGAIYCVLIAGGMSMIYPFWLMIVTSTTGEPEIAQYQVIPRYWYNRSALYQRFLQEKYQTVGEISATHALEAHAWRDIALPQERNPHAETSANLWQSFCSTLRPSDYALYCIGHRNMPGQAEILWRKFLQKQYATPADLGNAFDRQIHSFAEVFAPFDQPQGRLWPGVDGVEGQRWNEFKARLPTEYRRPVDGTMLWHLYLRQRYETADDFNRITGASVTNVIDVPLPRRLPENRLASDWQQWVRTQLSFRFVAIANGDRQYRDFLNRTFTSLALADKQLGTTYASGNVAWPPSKPTAAELDVINLFLRTGPAADELGVVTPDLQYQDFLAARFGGDVQAFNDATSQHAIRFAEIRPPYEQQDITTFTATAGQWRWWALTRNYVEVFDYIAIRGRSLWNTLFLCTSLVLASITVNPLAAYALSRFRLSLTNQVLTFLLATMAFPGEITMIPNFLLLRHFPIWSWAAGLVIGATVCGSILRGGADTLRWTLSIVLGLLAGVFTALYIVPGVGHLLGVDLGPISLLNTFPALILPRLAGGFSIFLLKGFFDSLPEELFEAARIDGANELRMLWNLALPMSTPILAVIVLQTFTAAYGSYLWALVVCQNDSMWTLMVHIFQLQQWAPSYLTMAAAVLCSLPTLLVFVAAQNVIMRGVVIPSER